MPTEIRNTKERTLADGTVQSLQFKIEEGKRPVPLGWKTIKAGSSSAEPKPEPKPAKAPINRRETPINRRTEEPAGESLWGWIVGAIATGAVVLGGLYVLAHRGS